MLWGARVLSRYAVYYLPPAGSPLAEFGARWLGRDPWEDALREQPEVAGLPAERLRAITASPRRYGFHATLKAPFAPAGGVGLAEVHEATAGLARRLRPVTIELELASLGGFLALVPARPSPALGSLAAACVTELDHLRAPLSPAELARRRQGSLSPREDELLRRWGYPYVLDAFRFHMTLTERLPEPEHGRLRAILAEQTAPFCAVPLTIDALAVLEQPTAEAPFVATRRFPLG